MEKSKKRISILRAFSGDLRHSRSKWTIAPFVALIVACGLAVGSCGVIKPVPVETNTEVHYVDSTILHIKDSVRITERSRWKDYVGLLDTLKIRGNRSEMRAWTDTTNHILNGSLSEDPIEEKTRIVYKDKIVYRDSVRTEEKPVPVEIIKEKKIYPKWMVILSILGIISTMVLAFQVYLKIKKTDLSKLIKK